MDNDLACCLKIFVQKQKEIIKEEQIQIQQKYNQIKQKLKQQTKLKYIYIDQKEKLTLEQFQDDFKLLQKQLDEALEQINVQIKYSLKQQIQQYEREIDLHINSLQQNLQLEVIH
ncbi:unnamed protein product [Didymodactylos carnosus]|uniref:Uncharacterized protein n=1 Tax=Didymodactylos carnosus TaxID=1234261 RepID=A0A8S2HZ83_9BILA|nr:unnamed protein product [Didymodactylos carnosus]CAF3698905.1 unnamed protein product [Didymodactylos carnosus]